MRKTAQLFDYCLWDNYNNYNQRKSSLLSKYRVMKACKGSRDKAPCILDLCTTERWNDKFIFPPATYSNDDRCSGEDILMKRKCIVQFATYRLTTWDNPFARIYFFVFTFPGVCSVWRYVHQLNYFTKSATSIDGILFTNARFTWLRFVAEKCKSIRSLYYVVSWK